MFRVGTGLDLVPTFNYMGNRRAAASNNFPPASVWRLSGRIAQM